MEKGEWGIGSALGCLCGISVFDVVFVGESQITEPIINHWIGGLQDMQMCLLSASYSLLTGIDLALMICTAVAWCKMRKHPIDSYDPLAAFALMMTAMWLPIIYEITFIDGILIGPAVGAFVGLIASAVMIAAIWSELRS